uniref:Uncharacterized protein n=1 Tax=uncultured Sphingobacterium sp. EB080_L08E11 TaxID=710992 RepID=E0Y0L5_9SPHI|nr:hypothetical protein [uncultured Sphingobacterium sp. EB080_L08E11]
MVSVTSLNASRPSSTVFLTSVKALSSALSKISLLISLVAFLTCLITLAADRAIPGICFGPNKSKNTNATMINSPPLMLKSRKTYCITRIYNKKPPTRQRVGGFKNFAFRLLSSPCLKHRT